MNKLNKREFLKLACVPAFAGRGGSMARAQSPTIVLKCGHIMPAAHPTHVRALEAAEGIRKETRGRVDMQVFPNGQLGSDSDQLSQVRSGAIDFYSLSPLVLGSLVPTAQITGVAFAFPDYDHVWPALDGELGKWVRAEIGKTSLFAFENIWDNGFRQMTSYSKPIHSPDDLAGFKMRVAVSPIFTSTFKGLGASPVSVNFTEVYSALQTHVVDGMENSLALLNSAKIYEVQKHCAVTNHMWDGFWMLGNQKNFARLPVDVQQIVQRNMNAAAIKQRQDLRVQNENLVGELTKKGMAFNNTRAADFRQRLRTSGFYRDWRARFGDQGWSVLEKYAGGLTA